MSSLVIYSRNGIVAEWHKQAPYSVSEAGKAVRTYATRERALRAAERRAMAIEPPLTAAEALRHARNRATDERREASRPLEGKYVA